MNTQIYILYFFLMIAVPLSLQGQRIQPDSVKGQGRNYEVFAEGWKPSNKALGGNIFLGTGFQNGNISEYFSNPFFVGINVDIHKNRFVFQVDDYFGFGATNKDLVFNEEQKWEKGKAAYSFMLGGNLGYTVFDNKNFKIVPLGGAGFSFLSSTFFGYSDFSEHEPFLPHYKIGMYIDFKSLVLLQDHVRINNEDENYTSLRLSFGFTDNIGKPKFSQYYQGSTFYITLGMGGLSRQFEKV